MGAGPRQIAKPIAVIPCSRLDYESVEVHYSGSGSVGCGKIVKVSEVFCHESTQG